MKILPPSIYFYGNKNVPMTLRSKAQTFYYFVANQIKLGGISSLTRTTSINGSTIVAFANKDRVYNSFINGYVKVFSSPPSFDENKRKRVFITYNDNLTFPISINEYYGTDYHEWEKYTGGKLTKLTPGKIYGTKSLDPINNTSRYWYNDDFAVNTNSNYIFINGSYYDIPTSAEFPLYSRKIVPGCGLKSKDTLLLLWWGTQNSPYVQPIGISLEVYTLTPGTEDNGYKGEAELKSSSMYAVPHPNQYDGFYRVFAAFNKDCTYAIWVNKYYSYSEDTYYYQYYKVTWEHDKDLDTYTLNTPELLYSIEQATYTDPPLQTTTFVSDNSPGTCALSGSIVGINGFRTPAGRTYGTWTTTYSFDNIQTLTQTTTCTWDREFNQILGEFWLEDNKLYWISRKIDFDLYHSMQAAIHEMCSYTEILTVEDDPDEGTTQNLLTIDKSQTYSYSKQYAHLETADQKSRHTYIDSYYVSWLDLNTKLYNEELIYSFDNTTSLDFTLPQITYNSSGTSHEYGYGGEYGVITSMIDSSYDGSFISPAIVGFPATTIFTIPPRDIPEGDPGPIALPTQDFSDPALVPARTMRDFHVMNLATEALEDTTWTPSGTFTRKWYGKTPLFRGMDADDPILQFLGYDYTSRSFIVAVKENTTTQTLNKNTEATTETTSEAYSVKIIQNGTIKDVSDITTTSYTSTYFKSDTSYTYPTIYRLLIDNPNVSTSGPVDIIYSTRDRNESPTYQWLTYIDFRDEDPSAWLQFYNPAKGYWFAENGDDFLCRWSQRMGARQFGRSDAPWGNSPVSYPSTTFMFTRGDGGLKLLTSDSNESGILDTVDMYIPITVNY